MPLELLREHRTRSGFCKATSSYEDPEPQLRAAGPAPKAGAAVGDPVAPEAKADTSCSVLLDTKGVSAASRGHCRARSGRPHKSLSPPCQPPTEKAKKSGILRRTFSAVDVQLVQRTLFPSTLRGNQSKLC